MSRLNKSAILKLRSVIRGIIGNIFVPINPLRNQTEQLLKSATETEENQKTLEQ